MLPDDFSNNITDDYIESEDIAGLPVNTKVLFSNHKNIYKKRTEKRQRMLLGSIKYIKPFLCDGEVILLITEGSSHISFFEQFFGGYSTMALKDAHFIFTNMRIIHIPLTFSGFSLTKNTRYRNSIAQILYCDCEYIKQSGHSLKVKYKSGKKEVFCRIKSKERKKIKSLVQQIPLDGEPSFAKERTHLCPRCQGILVKDIYECPNCQLDFKDKQTARKLSWMWPGGGFFYTGHHVMGVLDALAEVYIAVLLFLTLYDFAKGAIFEWQIILFFAMIMGLEKMVTVYHSSKFLEEFIPIEKEIVPYSRKAVLEDSQEYDFDDDVISV